MIGGCLSQKMMQNNVPRFHLWYVVSGFTLIGERNFKSRLTDRPPLHTADTQKTHLHVLVATLWEIFFTQ